MCCVFFFFFDRVRLRLKTTKIGLEKKKNGYWSRCLPHNWFYFLCQLSHSILGDLFLFSSLATPDYVEFYNKSISTALSLLLFQLCRKNKQKGDDQILTHLPTRNINFKCLAMWHSPRLIHFRNTTKNHVMQRTLCFFPKHCYSNLHFYLLHFSSNRRGTKVFVNSSFTFFLV